MSTGRCIPSLTPATCTTDDRGGWPDRGFSIVAVPDPGTLYRQVREEVAAFVRSLSPDQLDTPVPACPGWTVHGLVSHLAGVATDAVNGHLKGVPNPEQTAAQVAARVATPTSLVLREWERSGSQLEAVLARSESPAPAVVLDVVVHEQDMRGALGQPGNRQTPLVDLATQRVAGLWMSKVDSAGLPPVKVFDSGGQLVAGDESAPVTYQASPYELFRAGFGRRSRSQIERRFTGTDDPGAYVELLCLFGPADQDIVE